MVCFSISSSCRMLVLPELFVPKRPVIGASRICGMDCHDLKLVTDSWVSIGGILHALNVLFVISQSSAAVVVCRDGRP